MVLDDYWGSMMDQHESVTIALVKVPEGVASTVSYGAAPPLDLDEAEADETLTEAFSWHW